MGLYNRLEHFPRNHIAITPSNTADLPRDGLIIFCTSAGNVVARGYNGVDVTYAMEVGDILPIAPQRILATNTTATVIGLY